LQSIFWEGALDLFPGEFKRSAASAKIDGIWRDYGSGNITLKQARQQIAKTAGGIQTPDWLPLMLLCNH
jgi:hypothetical protein